MTDLHKIGEWLGHLHYTDASSEYLMCMFKALPQSGVYILSNVINKVYLFIHEL